MGIVMGRSRWDGDSVVIGIGMGIGDSDSQ